MRTLSILLFIVLVLGWACTCFFAVDQTEFAIVTRFGDPVRTCIQPGLGVKWPWPIDQVVRFDNRLMVLQSPGPDEPAKEYLTQDEQAGIGKNVMVTTYTCWRIKPDAHAVLTFLETMGNRANAEARLGDVVVSELGAALGRNDFTVLISTDESQRHWPEFMEAIRARCRQRVENDYGIEIVDIRIQRLNFPEQNRRNVFDRMRAERETIAARYRSEGEEQATAIRAKANREKEELLAEANKQAEITRGRADAEAARIYAEAYSQDPEFYEFLRTLEAYERTFDEKTVAILSADSEFLQLLNRAAEPDHRTAQEQPRERPASTTRPAGSE
jgi:membrane protease subunit HflC